MYQNADELISSIITRTAHKTDLSRIRDYLWLHGNPQQGLRCIHVAGTNGKGSTTNYLRSMLQAAGYKVGTFTSPHLEKHQDRIRINDVYIDDETFLDYGNRFDEEWKTYGLNMFEIDLFVSLLYFRKHQVDFAIYEVGMGGRLDSTNVITPLASVITNIGMDHMQYLGDTYEKIAEEKAGIIKDGIPLFTSETKKECLDVFRKFCNAHHSEMIQIPQAEIISMDPITFHYRNYRDLRLGNVAIYQVQNASLALEVIRYLQKNHQIRIGIEEIRRGLLTIWRGRFEQLLDDPLTIVDGAHNLEGIQALCRSLELYEKPKTIVFCAMKDKPVYPMIQELMKYSEDITVTEISYPRCFRVAELDDTLPVKREPDYQKAIEQALKNKDHMVVVTGSLYFISEAREYLQRKRRTQL